MESRYALIGRQTMEKFLQKKAAAERPSSAAASGKTDKTALLIQLKELETRNNNLDEENKVLSSKLQSKETENAILRTRLNDLSVHLRTVTKRLRDAEEEQYKAEEDSAAMRAELNCIQQQALSEHHVTVMVREKQMHDMGAVIERLEVCRQKLLKEVDSQSKEIERLSEENSVLSSAYEKALAVLEARDMEYFVIPAEMVGVSLRKTSTVKHRAGLVQFIQSKLWGLD